MSVQLDPVELGFRRPFTQEVEETLRLRNPNSDPVAFKVKTTAPKQYCVRPNSGRIEPGQYVEVSVLLQAMKEDPPLEAKCRDKFLVQSVAVPANHEFTNVASVWSAVEQTSKSSIQEKKIRVTFLPSSGSAAPNASDSTPSRGTSMGAMTADDEPPAYGSPMSNVATPAQRSAVGAAGPVSTMDDRPAYVKSLGDAKESAFNPAVNQESSSGTAGSSIKQEANSTGQSQPAVIASKASNAASGAAQSVAAVIPTTSEEMKEQLAKANAQISRLTAQAAESTGLRQRKGDSLTDTARGTSSGQTGLSMQQPPNGVPVPIVAALCLLSFLLAYLLF